MEDKLDLVLTTLKALSEQLTGVNTRLSSLEHRLAAAEGRNLGERVEPFEIKLESPSLQLTTAENPEVLLCMDFGTARSKAFATNTTTGDLIDIALGNQSASRTTHSVLSCVYVSDDGRIYFSDAAAIKSERAVLEGKRKRIDSFKEMITNTHTGGDLNEVVIPNEFNPTSIPLTEGDILSLFLAYLTDLAVGQLAKEGVSRYVRRRFTIPVFSKDHQNWAFSVMRKHYAEAILIADHFSGRWDDGIPVAEAKAVIQSARRLGDKVNYLLVPEIVTEPVAAFGSRFRNYVPEKNRRLFLSIIDVGAGTTDFATFAVIEEIGRGLKLFLVPGSMHAVRRAGNAIDQILHEYIINDAEKRYGKPQISMLNRIRADLMLRQRLLKEQLFREGRVRYDLVNDVNGEVVLSEFLKDPMIQRFSEDIRTEFEKSLRSIDTSYIREGLKGGLTVVLTGGGATLPMIKDLSTGDIGSLCEPVSCTSGQVIPAWITDEYNELKDDYPQLAVAIGGSSSELPSLAEERFVSFDGLKDQGKWVIPVAYKGS